MLMMFMWYCILFFLTHEVSHIVLFFSSANFCSMYTHGYRRLGIFCHVINVLQIVRLLSSRGHCKYFRFCVAFTIIWSSLFISIYPMIFSLYLDRFNRYHYWMVRGNLRLSVSRTSWQVLLAWDAFQRLGAKK